MVIHPRLSPSQSIISLHPTPLQYYRLRFGSPHFQASSGSGKLTTYPALHQLSFMLKPWIYWRKKKVNKLKICFNSFVWESLWIIYVFFLFDWQICTTRLELWVMRVSVCVCLCVRVCVCVCVACTCACVCVCVCVCICICVCVCVGVELVYFHVKQQTSNIGGDTDEFTTEHTFPPLPRGRSRQRHYRLVLALKTRAAGDISAWGTISKGSVCRYPACWMILLRAGQSKPLEDVYDEADQTLYLSPLPAIVFALHRKIRQLRPNTLCVDTFFYFRI